MKLINSVIALSAMLAFAPVVGNTSDYLGTVEEQEEMLNLLLKPKGRRIPQLGEALFGNEPYGAHRHNNTPRTENEIPPKSSWKKGGKGKNKQDRRIT